MCKHTHSSRFQFVLQSFGEDSILKASPTQAYRLESTSMSHAKYDGGDHIDQASVKTSAENARRNSAKQICCQVMKERLGRNLRATVAAYRESIRA